MTITQQIISDRKGKTTESKDHKLPILTSVY